MLVIIAQRKHVHELDELAERREYWSRLVAIQPFSKGARPEAMQDKHLYLIWKSVTSLNLQRLFYFVPVCGQQSLEWVANYDQLVVVL